MSTEKTADLIRYWQDEQYRKSLTPAQIQEAAKLYFNTNNYARFVLLPENGKTTPDGASR